MFEDILILLMGSQQVTFTTMQRYAGARRLLQGQMLQNCMVPLMKSLRSL
jgi:hypothetical protein